MFIEYKSVELTGDIDGELLPIKCLCGYGKNHWEFTINIYKEHPKVCPKCGRKYYFDMILTVFVDQGTERECVYGGDSI